MDEIKPQTEYPIDILGSMPMPVMNFEEALEKARAVTDPIEGNVIDEKILALVASCLMFGVDTIQSCQGHDESDDQGRLCSSPFVQADPNSIATVVRLLEWHNECDVRIDPRDQKNQWILHVRSHALSIEPANKSRVLDQMQKGAEVFAENLVYLARQRSR